MKEEEQNWYLVGAFHNGILRGHIGSCILPASCEGYPDRPVPQEFVDAAQRDSVHAGFNRPIGAGWQQIVVKGRSHANATSVAWAAGKGDFLRFTVDRGDVEIVCLDNGSWDFADNCRRYTVSSETIALLQKGTKDISSVDDGTGDDLGADKKRIDGMRDCLRLLIGSDVDPSIERIAESLDEMTNQDVADWIFGAASMIDSLLPDENSH
jgi:hypothetical protein